MEVSVIGSFEAELVYRELGFCNLKGGKNVISSKNGVCFGRSTGWRKSGIRFTLRATAAIQSEPPRSDSVSGRSRRSKSNAGLKLQKEPSIFFTDRAGQQYKECLSLAVDDLPVLDGKTPVQVYREFCEVFKSSFSSFMGSTITGISMGLGPDGELRYPSHQRLVKSNKITGVGEFQCYDKNMLSILKQHAEANGNPLKQHPGPPLIFAPPSPPPPGPPLPPPPGPHLVLFPPPGPPSPPGPFGPPPP